VNRANLSQTQPLPPSANHSTTERYAPYYPAFFAGVDSRDRNAFLAVARRLRSRRHNRKTG
jgi:hypothetical protein